MDGGDRLHHGRTQKVKAVTGRHWAQKRVLGTRDKLMSLIRLERVYITEDDGGHCIPNKTTGTLLVLGDSVKCVGMSYFKEKARMERLAPVKYIDLIIEGQFP